MRGLRTLSVVAALAACLVGAPASAQQPAPRDTVRANPADSLRARQLRLLERLGREPGLDTVPVTPPGPRPGQVAPGGRSVGAAVAIPGDTISEQLLKGLTGYDPIEYSGTSANFDARTRDLLLRGDSARRATVKYDGNQVVADTSVTYNSTQDRVRALGNPVLTPAEGQGEPLESRLLVLDVGGKSATAYGARTRFQQGANWIVVGDLPRLSQDTLFGSKIRFTSDELPVPTYFFEANRVKIVAGKILVAAPVKLYFADTPVMWLPFMAQSLTRGRASGILTPRFSINDIVRASGGYQRRISNVGFYWAMSDYTDASLAMDWFSGNYTALSGSMRYRWQKQFINGGFSVREFWRANGGTEFSVNGRHDQQLSERTNFNANVQFTSSAAFVRQNSFDPLEATQNIMSQGGFSHQFDWGTLNLFGSRSQSLSDDRVDLTLPRATLSMKPVTFNKATPGRESAFSNITWSAGGSASRRTLDLPEADPIRPFALTLLDQASTQVQANHSFSLGRLSLGQDLRLDEGVFRGVPRDSIPYFGSASGPAVDLHRATLDWGTSLSYQITIPGTQTSFTPNITYSSSSIRSDTLELARNFVAAPTRLYFGAQLQSQLYGFFPGFGPYERLRHKIAPSITYRYAPEVTPTPLQLAVFGRGTSLLKRNSEITVGISQTFEAKRRVDPEAEARQAAARQAAAPPSLPGDSLAPMTQPVDSTLSPDAPRRRPQGQIVNLLSLYTSALSYDFVRADSLGFLLGFTSTRLRNEITSDFLRGLTFSVEHDLFADSLVGPITGVRETQRRFDPHLSAVNLRFQLNGSSSLFRWLGLGSGDAVGTETGEDPFTTEDPFNNPQRRRTDASIIPGQPNATPTQQPRRTAREWNAAFQYSLTRPRVGQSSFLNEPAQTLRMNFQTQPTVNWSMNWGTSYDLEEGRFNDHNVTLTRDLRRWQANFAFAKTVTGNWQFSFSVELLDNPDLHFDYDQRSIDENRRLVVPSSSIP